ncbi:MAG: MFS transporter [bacterium]
MWQNLRSTYIFFITLGFFSNLFKSLMAPFWVIYFHSIGLNFEQISLLLVINHLVTVIFEIPTGAIADLFSRKFSVVISLLIAAVSAIGVYFSNSFLILLILYGVSGLGATFSSGAFESWFADSLLDFKKDIELTKYWGHFMGFVYLGAALGMVGGGIFVHYKILRPLWLVEGLGILSLCLYVFFLGRESKFMKNTDEKVTYKLYLNKITTGVPYLLKNKLLKLTCVGSLLFFFSSGIISLLWQPYFKSVNISLEYFGVISAITLGAGILFPHFAEKIKNTCGGDIITLSFISAVCSLFLFFMFIFSKFSFIPYIIYTSFYTLHTPIFMAYFNLHIPSSERATIISTYNLLISLITILCTYTFGALANYINLNAPLLLASGISMISAVIFDLTKNHEKFRK